MPFNGSGTFNRVMNWVADAAAGVKIRADRHDSEDDNLAAGLSMCLTKDGQTTPTGDIKLGGRRLINVGDPTTAQDAVTRAWVEGNVVGGARISDTPPTAKVGELWWESDSGNLYLRYDDSTSVQWVQVNAAQPIAQFPGQWELIDTKNGDGSAATVDFDYQTGGWPTDYSDFRLDLDSVGSTVDNGYPYLRVKIGGTWLASSTNYNWGISFIGNSGTPGGDGAAGTGAITTLIALARTTVGGGIALGSAGYNGTVIFRNPTDEAAATRAVLFRSEGIYPQQGAGVPARVIGGGAAGSGSLVQGVRVGATTAVTATSRVRLYGKRR